MAMLPPPPTDEEVVLRRIEAREGRTNTSESSARRVAEAHMAFLSAIEAELFAKSDGGEGAADASRARCVERHGTRGTCPCSACTRALARAARRRTQCPVPQRACFTRMGVILKLTRVPAFAVSEAAYERVLWEVSQLRAAGNRNRKIVGRCALESAESAARHAQIDAKVAEIRTDIENLQRRLDEARLERRNKEEYETLARVINTHASRSQLAVYVPVPCFRPGKLLSDVLLCSGARDLSVPQ